MRVTDICVLIDNIEGYDKNDTEFERKIAEDILEFEKFCVEKGIETVDENTDIDDVEKIITDLRTIPNTIVRWIENRFNDIYNLYIEKGIPID